MSWDVMLFNFGGTPPANFEELAGDYPSKPLGSAAGIRDAISKQLPDVDWSDPAWGIYDGDGFSIEFNTGNRDPVDSVMLHVRGGGNAVAAMMQFAEPNQWTLFDCSTGEFLDPENPSPEGWEGFQAFRDKVIGSDDSEKET